MSRRTLRSGREYSPYGPNAGRRRELGFEHLDTEDNEEDNQMDEEIDNHLIEEEYDALDDYEDHKRDEHIPNYYQDVRRDMHNVENKSPPKTLKPKSGHKLPNKSDQLSQSNNSSCNWLLWIIGILLTLTSGCLVAKDYWGSLFPINTPNELNKWQIFNDEFNGFRQKYSQVLPPIGLKVLNVAVKKVLDDNSNYDNLMAPAVVLLVASDDHSNVLDCVANDLVAAINKAYNETDSVRIDGKQTNSRDIVDKFDDNFDIQGKHTIIVENVQTIEAQDMMSLHQYTDHHNSRYREAVIVLKAINYKRITLDPNAKQRDMDSIATELFQMMWKNTMQEEQRFALISRLTPSVVTIIDNDPNIKC